MTYFDKPRKVHLYHDWKGATYGHGQKQKPYAPTLCKGNFSSNGLLTTDDHSKVTCQSCYKKMLPKIPTRPVTKVKRSAWRILFDDIADRPLAASVAILAMSWSLYCHLTGDIDRGIALNILAIVATTRR